jgi:hypothetical protein
VKSRRRVEGAEVAEYTAELAAPPDPASQAIHDRLRAELARYVATAPRRAVVSAQVLEVFRNGATGEVLCWRVALQLECGHATTNLNTPKRPADTERPCSDCYRATRIEYAEQVDLIEPEAAAAAM